MLCREQDAHNTSALAFGGHLGPPGILTVTEFGMDHRGQKLII